MFKLAAETALDWAPLIRGGKLAYKLRRNLRLLVLLLRLRRNAPRRSCPGPNREPAAAPAPARGRPAETTARRNPAGTDSTRPYGLIGLPYLIH